MIIYIKYVIEYEDRGEVVLIPVLKGVNEMAEWLDVIALHSLKKRKKVYFERKINSKTWKWYIFRVN